MHFLMFFRHWEAWLFLCTHHITASVQLPALDGNRKWGNHLSAAKPPAHDINAQLPVYEEECLDRGRS